MAAIYIEKGWINLDKNNGTYQPNDPISLLYYIFSQWRTYASYVFISP